MDTMEDQFCVPDFEMCEDYFMPCSSSLLTRTKKSAIVEDEMAELLWQNGEVVVQRSGKASHGGSNGGEEEAEAEGDAKRMRSAAEETARLHVFMQEDELTSWLHYSLDEPEHKPAPKPEPVFDRYEDTCADLLYPPPFNTTAPSREIRTSTAETPPQMPPPPPPPSDRSIDLKGSFKFRNFGHFSRIPKAASVRSRIESGTSGSSKAAAVEKEPVVVESSNAPPVVVSNPRTSISHVAPDVELVTMGTDEGAVGTSTTARELATTTRERTAKSSPGGLGASASPAVEPSTAEDRKKKGREADDNEDNSVGIEESGETKKQARGSTSSRKSRAAEVHNLSERRRRDRINEKMRALQELIPRCNKADKASMLDDAIEYLKSLQLQVQMMSLGYSMVPMMYAGVHHYMTPMNIGIGMGMDMGVNRPMVPYPHLLSGSPIPGPAAAARMGPRFPMPAFHMPPVPVPDPSTSQASNASDSMLNSLAPHSANLSQSQFPNFVDPYQQYLSHHHGQVHIPQNQAVVQPSTEKPSSRQRFGYPENHQPGA